MSLGHPQWLGGWQPAHYRWCLQSHLVSCFYAGSLCHQLQSVWPCRVNFLSMKCGFGLHLWLLWKSDRGFLPLTLKKMVKRPTVFWALVFVGFLCTFLPGCFILSFSQALLCLSQHLCMYVPSHPLEQVGACTAGPKTEHGHGTWPSPASHGGAMPANVSQKCYSSATRGDSQQ